VLQGIEDLLLLIWYLCCIFMEDIVPYIMEVVQRVVLTTLEKSNSFIYIPAPNFIKFN